MGFQEAANSLSLLFCVFHTSEIFEESGLDGPGGWVMSLDGAGSKASAGGEVRREEGTGW